MTYKSTSSSTMVMFFFAMKSDPNSLTLLCTRCLKMAETILRSCSRGTGGLAATHAHPTPYGRRTSNSSWGKLRTRTSIRSPVMSFSAKPWRTSSFASSVLLSGCQHAD